VDTGNYYPRQRDGRIKEIEDGLTEIQWSKKQVRSARSQSVQQQFYAEHLTIGAAARQPRTIAFQSRVANPQRRPVVLRLVDELGFDGVDAGGLDESWRNNPTRRLRQVLAMVREASEVSRAHRGRLLIAALARTKRRHEHE